jgi:hypothetical protein
MNVPPRPSITELYEQFEYPHNDWVKWVSIFHTSRLDNDFPILPTLVEDGRVEFNLKHLQEELDEMKSAAECGDLVELADGIADLIYVAIGLALRLGLPLEAIFAEVHTSNMEKTHNPDAHLTQAKRVIKPEGWQKPRILELLRYVDGLVDG